MPVSARIAVIDRDAAAFRSLADRLAARGYDAVAVEAAADDASIPLPQADIYLLLDQDATSIAAGLHERTAAMGRPLLVRDPTLADLAEVLLSPRFSDAELFARLDATARLTTMANELRRRGAVTALYGGEAPAVPPRATATGAIAKILFVGTLGSEAVAIADALGPTAELVVTADGNTALDRLQTQVFEAILFPAHADPSETLEFAADLRRNPRLFHIPLVATADPSGVVGEAQYYAAGISQVWRRPIDPQLVRGQTGRLVDEYRYRLALMKAHRQVRHPATTDALTLHYTFGFLMEILKAQIAEALSENKNLSIALIDVARMQELNQLVGYVGGDRLLRQIAGLIGNSMRGEDVIARFGGATFALVLPDTPPDTAGRVITRVASIVEHTELSLPGREDPVFVHLRTGIASIAPGDDPAAILARATGNLK